MANREGRPSLNINERVVWISDEGPEYGRIRWLGKLPDIGTDWMAGVEFDNPVGSGTGLYKEKQLFLTPMNHASLVPIMGLMKATDFDEPQRTECLVSRMSRASLSASPIKPKSEIPSLPEPTLSLPARLSSPFSMVEQQIKTEDSYVTRNFEFIGKSRGIQGNNNSCYLDATLFAMFSSTTLFDSMLYRHPDKNDIPSYTEIQRILREDIVRNLRTENFVSAEQVMNFRTILEKSSTVAGLTDEEKDPEEFLSLLLGQILKAEPYLKLSTGLESFFYQLIVDKDESVVLPTVQDLFEQSFSNSNIQLREIPPCLLIQMPRFGRQYKMYSRIMPSLRLDITDVLESAPRACGHRGKDCDNIARYECRACYKEKVGRKNSRLMNVTFCNNCFKSKHFSRSHITGIEDHDLTKTILDKTSLEAIKRYSVAAKGTLKNKEVPRVEMDLFAVLCIETSHYVCFVKCGSEINSGWCFFDSMADRKGEQNGYNIPEVLPFDDMAFWTSDKGMTFLLNHKDDKLIPDMAKRLICDSYLCFYQYNDLLSYR